MIYSNCFNCLILYKKKQFIEWNEKNKDRKDFQRSYSNDPWMDDRHSPDDMLPEWYYFINFI